jgi:hypothetical protein
VGAPDLRRECDQSGPPPAHLGHNRGNCSAARTRLVDVSPLGTGHSGALSGTATVAASGTLSDSVAVNYSQVIDSTELLATGSVYSLTAAWTISAT